MQFAVMLLGIGCRYYGFAVGGTNIFLLTVLRRAVFRFLRYSRSEPHRRIVQSCNSFCPHHVGRQSPGPGCFAKGRSHPGTHR